jgi:hypothetical protein
MAGKRQEPVTVWVKNIPDGKVKEIELIYEWRIKWRRVQAVGSGKVCYD